MTSLDVQDFDKSAVTCFVDCLYTGGIELLGMNDFRDVNKMGHVFEVEWLVGRCRGYFTDYLARYEHDEFDDNLPRLAEDGWYLYTTLKKDTSWNLVMEAVNYLGLRDRILSHYVAAENAFESLSTSQLDMLMTIAANKNDKLLKSVMVDIQKSQILSGNSVYILKNLDVRKFMPIYKKVLCDLFITVNEVDGVSKENLQLVSKLQLDTLKFQDSQPDEIKNWEMQAGHIGFIFRPLEPIETDDFFDFHAQVSNKTTVQNFYTFIDYLFTWIENHQDSVREWSADWTAAISELKSRRKWKSIQKEYVISWGLSEAVLRLLEQSALFPESDEANQFYRTKHECWGGIIRDNENKLSVFDLMNNQPDLHKLRRHPASGKRSYSSLSDSSVITIGTLVIPIDNSAQIIYYLESGCKENLPRECNEDFHLSVSGICHATDPEDVKNFKSAKRDLDEKLPVPRKASLGRLVKRPDMFGNGNVWKIRGKHMDDIILTENSYLILALYD